MKNEIVSVIVALLVVVMLVSIFSLTMTVCVGREVADLKTAVESIERSEADRYNDLDQRLTKIEEAIANETHS